MCYSLGHRNPAVCNVPLFRARLIFLSAFWLQQLTSEVPCCLFYVVCCIVVGITVVSFVYHSGLSDSGFGLSIGLIAFIERELSPRFHKPSCPYGVCIGVFIKFVLLVLKTWQVPLCTQILNIKFSSVHCCALYLKFFCFHTEHEIQFCMVSRTALPSQLNTWKILLCSY